nr:uncharacterized protein LOC105709792 isoform X2 [Aotus nancymaae]
MTPGHWCLATAPPPASSRNAWQGGRACLLLPCAILGEGMGVARQREPGLVAQTSPTGPSLSPGSGEGLATPQSLVCTEATGTCAWPRPRSALGSVSTCLRWPLVPLHLLRPVPSWSLPPAGPEQVQRLPPRSLQATSPVSVGPPTCTAHPPPPGPGSGNTCRETAGRGAGGGRGGAGWGQQLSWALPHPQSCGKPPPCVISFPLSRIDRFPGVVSTPLLRNYRSTGRKSTPRKIRGPFTQQKMRTQQGPGTWGQRSWAASSQERSPCGGPWSVSGSPTHCRLTGRRDCLVSDETLDFRINARIREDFGEVLEGSHTPRM